MNYPLQIAPGPIYQRETPVRDPGYLKFIRSIGVCIACGRNRRTEAMHSGPHGIGQKASDRDALPGCHECHRTGPHALHKIGPVRFQDYWRVDFAKQRLNFQTFYDSKLRKQVA